MIWSTRSWVISLGVSACLFTTGTAKAYQRRLQQALAPDYPSQAFPVSQCGQLDGPCEDTRCPPSASNCTGDLSYCAPLVTSAAAGFDHQVCLNASSTCGQTEGGPCCPPRYKGYNGANGKGFSYCSADGLFCPSAYGDLRAECKRIPTGCGGLNQTCCPTLYRQSTDKDVPILCGNFTYCGPDMKCVLNSADCGTLGKACCRHSIPSSVVTYCDPGLLCPYNSQGPTLPCASCSSPENLLNPACMNPISTLTGVPPGIRPSGPQAT